MTLLPKLFADFRGNPQRYLATAKGDEFEKRIDSKLHNLGYSRLSKEHDDGVAGMLAGVKADVLRHYGGGDIANPSADYRRHFVLQPFGSQSYPDFAVFDGGRLICMETKFSERGQGSPFWNSGLPRQRGIYVFAATGKRNDITFFRGCDVVTEEETKTLLTFFEGLKKSEKELNRKMAGQRYGFACYVRKAFQQQRAYNKDAVTNFFANPHRAELEDSVLSYLARAAPLPRGSGGIISGG